MITLLYYDDYSLLWWGKISCSSVSVCLHATEVQPWNRYCKIKISKRILKHLWMKNNVWYCLQIVISWKGRYRWFKQGRHVEITDRVCQVRNWQAPKGRVSVWSSKNWHSKIHPGKFPWKWLRSFLHFQTVSQSTIYRRMAAFALSKRNFSQISDNELDLGLGKILKDFPSCGENLLKHMLIIKKN